MAMAAKQVEALEAKIPVCTPQNYYETLMELTKAADFASPDRFWTDPQKIPAPPPQPPEAIIVAQIKAQSSEKETAAKIVQEEVESQRKNELDKYAIDVNAGMAILRDQADKAHEASMEG